MSWKIKFVLKHVLPPVGDSLHYVLAKCAAAISRTQSELLHLLLFNSWMLDQYQLLASSTDDASHSVCDLVHAMIQYLLDRSQQNVQSFSNVSGMLSNDDDLNF
ncbi:hypothetical protein J6590_012787 [Homalodisca vitripennis]|nr:hypothetical protein J6590_012787 [Homalodisca vitripennis]